MIGEGLPHASRDLPPRDGTRLNSSVHPEGEAPFCRRSSRINMEYRDSMGIGLPRGRNLEFDDEFNRECANYESLDRATPSP